MPRTRRDLLLSGTALLSVGGLAALAGCSSTCPDSGRPTAEHTLSIDDQPVGSFAERPAGTWPAERGDASNTGNASGTAPTPPLSIRWRTALPIPTEEGVGTTASAPVVGPERVFIADPQRIHALALLSGDRDWQSESFPVTQTERYASHRPETIAPRVGPAGRLFVGLDDGLVALDRQDGGVRWRARGLTDVAPPTVVGDTLVAQGEASVRAYALDGTRRWERAVSRGNPRRQPAATDGVVVVQTETGLQALDPATGDRLWARERQVEAGPAIRDGTCFFGTGDGLEAVEAATGRERYTYSRREYMAFQSLVVTPESVYVVEQPPEAGAAAFALDRESAGVAPRWCSAIGDGVLTAATADQVLGLLDLGQGPGSSHSLVGFTADRGEVPWAVTGGTRSDAWLNPPAVLDGALVVTTRGGTVLAIAGGE